MLLQRYTTLLVLGKKVDQYHDFRKDLRSVINLGKFDVEKHKAWITKNPGKAPKPVNVRKHVSHFYSNGDICDITSKCPNELPL